MHDSAASPHLSCSAAEAVVVARVRMAVVHSVSYLMPASASAVE